MVIGDKRELAYMVKIDDIQPIEGADRVELAFVGGWRVMVRREQFKPGDYGIYFEIDSMCPPTEPFLFLESKHFKVKTQRYFKGAVTSQGLLMSLDDFTSLENPPAWAISMQKRIEDGVDVTHETLTEAIGVTYAEPGDNSRKANSVDKYKSIAARHQKLFKTKPFRWLMRREWGKKLLFVFFGRKKDNKKGFPTHFPYIHKTDEERIENMPWVLEDKRKLIASEKLDGTSSTYILERKGRKFEFYVLSRNVRQLTPNQTCYHEDNIYWQNAILYNIEQHLKDYLRDNPSLNYVCIQGESVGNVQGNPLKLPKNDLYIFNFIRSDVGRLSSLDGKEIIESWGMKWVPIVTTEWVNPDTMEEMKALADGKSLVNPAADREGLVYRDIQDNTFSFKNVSNQFLLRHGG